ncbi:Retrotransposable element [Phytophthora cinnamomi]|nr:Retrotransposable element [Phytophthora cinnamomi]
MPKFNEGGPKDFLDWAYHFSQLAKLKHWNAEDKFLNANILLEEDLLEAFEDAAFTDEDTRMDEEFSRVRSARLQLWSYPSTIARRSKRSSGRCASPAPRRL